MEPETLNLGGDNNTEFNNKAQMNMNMPIYFIYLEMLRRLLIKFYALYLTNYLASYHQDKTQLHATVCSAVILLCYKTSVNTVVVLKLKHASELQYVLFFIGSFQMTDTNNLQYTNHPPYVWRKSGERYNRECPQP